MNASGQICCCARCGMVIQSWTLVNGNMICDFCKPKTEERHFANPWPGSAIDAAEARIMAKLDLILKKLDSDMEDKNG